jgi:hypothetical protein
MNINKKVIILGDSITRHYYPYAQTRLLMYGIESFEPVRKTSCQWKQLRFLNRTLSPKRKYNGKRFDADFVHFNFGLHSIKLPNKGKDILHRRTTDSDFKKYEIELFEQILILKKLKVLPLFSNTTPSPRNHSVRNNEDVIILNKIAKHVMKEMKVPYNDLYSFVLNQQDSYKLYKNTELQNNCHFTSDGRKLLGEKIAEFIKNNT